MKKLTFFFALVLLSIGLTVKSEPPAEKPKVKPAELANDVAKEFERLLRINVKNKEGKQIQPNQLQKLVEKQLQAQQRLLQQRVPLKRPLVQPIPGRIPVPNIRPGISSRPNIPMARSRPKGEAVQLLNGDVLSGKFVGYTPDKGLIWRHPSIKPDLNVDPLQIARVTFESKKVDSKRQNCRITLTNGDELSGELNGLNGKQLALKTWYGGELKINRDAIRTVIPGQAISNLIYEDEGKKDGWVFSNSSAMLNIAKLPNGAVLPPAVLERRRAQAEAASKIKWAYDNGVFQSNGSNAQIGRNFDMTDRVNIEFDVEWTSSLSLYISLFTDNLKHYSQGNSYSLRLSQSSSYLYRYESGPNMRRSSRVGTTHSYNMRGQPGKAPRAHISIRIDKPKKLIALIINDTKIAEWKDPGNFAGKGEGILFRSGTTGTMRLANIRISEWDGSLPGKVDITGGNSKEDFVRLANEDTLNGKLLSITDGKIIFSTSFAPKLPIPVSRVSVIKMAENPNITKSDSKAVRLTLKESGQITALLKEWKDEKVILTSPTFGEATLDANAVESIEFNINQTKVSAVSPDSPAKSTINIDVKNAFGGAGRLNINGARIEILPRNGGFRFEQKIEPQRLVPRKR